MIRVLVVGMNPGSKEYADQRQSPFHKRVSQWMTEAGVEFYSFTNCSMEKGDLTITTADLMRLTAIVQSGSYDLVLALGNQSSNVMSYINVEHFRGPHPSGLNRKLNDKKFVDEFLSALREQLSRADINNRS